jgi:hypothetical protein
MKPITYSFALVVALASAPAFAQPADDDKGSAAPADATAPAAKPAPDAAPDASDDADVDTLRQEYLKLRDELFRARARVATVASAMYSTKLRVHLDYTTARFYSVTRATVRLDGSNVFDDTQAAVAKDKAPRFDGFIAPGRHQIEVRIEAIGKDDERFKSVITNSFTVQAPAGKDLIVRIKAKDGGDIPYKWKKKQAGTYRLHLDARVKAIKRAAAKSAKSAKSSEAGTQSRKSATSTKNATRSNGKRTKTASRATR